MKLHSLDADALHRAIGIYQDIAYGKSDRRRGPDLQGVAGNEPEALLALFQKEQFEPIPGYPCVRYSLRLGNRNYPFMKLVLQEHLVAGEFFFAVNTHDQMDIKPDYPDYEAWVAVRRFNRGLKRQIEEAFAEHGLDTAACLRRSVMERSQTANPDQVASTAVDAQVRTVLVVDDEEELADTVELLLTARGFRVFKVHDGAAAVTATAELLPDLVLLDYELPELDGIEVLSRLRADEGTRDIPVLLSSAAKVSLADIKRAEGFLAKPFQEAMLYEMVDRVLRLGRGVKS